MSTLQNPWGIMSTYSNLSRGDFVGGGGGGDIVVSRHITLGENITLEPGEGEFVPGE